ncbi:addiction module protein [Maribacter sp. 4G9]|uniref:addiction module protein n=1 Tax=Maribacter sp. 4G9 TaxID=1889777 RepID=UPI000C149476|nr:addiction module protein [Maribacter sp. 4G9]PIB25178.1 hypothetical protein BFP75_09875 [Maribacter sp. 4G9]
MATLDLKKSVLNYIDNADDRLLKLIKALVETYQEEETDYEISEEHRKVLDQRLADHKANPDSGKDWKVLKPELRKKYGA